MSAVTQQQIQKMGFDHLDLFRLLADASLFRVNLAKQYGLDSPAFNDFNREFVDLAHNWINREIEIEQLFMQNTGEKGMVLSGDLSLDDFWTEAAQPKLRQLIKKASDYYKNLEIA